MSAQASPAAHKGFRTRETKVSALQLYYPLLAPPLLWAFEMIVNFAVSSHACFPSGAPRADFLPGWEQAWRLALAVNVACAAAAALGLALSASLWRSLRRRADEGTDSQLLRVLAVSGLLVSALFTLAILFNTLSLGMLSTCSRA